MFESFKQVELDELYSVLGPRKNKIVIERIIDLNDVLPIEVLSANVDIVRSEAAEMMEERTAILESIDLATDSNIQILKKVKESEKLMRANNALWKLIDEITEAYDRYVCDE